MTRHWVVVLGVVGLLWGSSLGVVAQTVGVGVKVPVELAQFAAANLTDNLEIFGQARVSLFALEASVLVPFSPFAVGAVFKLYLFELPVFVGGGGTLISFGDISFTAFLVKAGLEWGSPAFPLKLIVEGGWQTPIEFLQGTGGPFLSMGLRWDL